MMDLMSYTLSVPCQENNHLNTATELPFCSTHQLGQPGSENPDVKIVWDTPSSKSKTNTAAVSLAGSAQKVAQMKSVICSQEKLEYVDRLNVQAYDVFNANNQLKSNVKETFDEISATTGAQISVLPPTNDNLSKPVMIIDGLADAIITIQGTLRALDVARIRCLAFIDQLSGASCDAFPIEASLVPIVCGRQRHVLERIMQDTLTNIYCPSPLVYTDKEMVMIKITGDAGDVSKAKSILGTVSNRKKPGIISSTVAFPAPKVEWLLQRKRRELEDVMFANGVSLSFSAGEQSRTISVTGDNSSAIQNGIKDIFLLSSQLCQASIAVSSTSDRLKTIAQATSLHALNRISCQAGGTIVVKANTIDIYCEDAKVIMAIQSIVADFHLQGHINMIRLRMELFTDYKEFLSGKKNGKMNKIMKSAGVKIDFVESRDCLTVEISSSALNQIAEGFAQLQDELPAELAFFVPDAHHKRIIGVGGKNIQRIMKKYGVYVKFSSADEFSNLGGLLDNDFNVIARTPSKNANNLENLKRSVTSLVDPRENEHVSILVALPRRFHKSICGRQRSQAKAIESKTNTIIKLPALESGKESITVKGLYHDVQLACQLINEITPETHQLRCPAHPDVPVFVQSQEFADLTSAIKKECGFTLSFGMSGSGADHAFNVKGTRALTMHNQKAIGQIIEALKSKALPIYPEELIMSLTENIRDAAAHTSQLSNFDGRKLRVANKSPPASAAANLPDQMSHSFSNYTLFEKGGGHVHEMFEIKGARGAGSAPNLRSLFGSAAVGGPASPRTDAAVLSDSSSGHLADGMRSSAQSLGQSELRAPPGLQGINQNANGGLPAPNSNYWNQAPEPDASQINTNGNAYGHGSKPLHHSAAVIQPHHHYAGSHLKVFTGALSANPGLRMPSPRSAGGFDAPGLQSRTRKPTGLQSFLTAPPNSSEAADVDNMDNADNDILNGSALLDAIMNIENTSEDNNSLDLAKYKPIFAAQEVDFAMFLTLTNDDLKELGVTFGARRKLTSAISNIRYQQQSANSAASSAAIPSASTSFDWPHLSQMANYSYSHSSGSMAIGVPSTPKTPLSSMVLSPSSLSSAFPSSPGFELDMSHPSGVPSRAAYPFSPSSPSSSPSSLTSSPQPLTPSNTIGSGPSTPATPISANSIPKSATSNADPRRSSRYPSYTANGAFADGSGGREPPYGYGLPSPSLINNSMSPNGTDANARPSSSYFSFKF